MKFKNFRSLFAGCLMAATLISLLTFAPEAKAQVSPVNLARLTNFPATVAAGAGTVTTNIIALPVHGGASLTLAFNAASGTWPMGVWYSFSGDGTNFNTTPQQLIANANSTTKVVLQTNWSAAQLAGFSYVNVHTLTNAAANGILTNQGAFVNRANYKY